MPRNSIVPRKKKERLEDLPLPKKETVDYLAKTLSKQIDEEIFRKKYAPVGEVLKLVGAGVFFAASIAIPNLPLAIKPFLKETSSYEIWKRYNIPYLKRTLKRLEKQKLIELDEENNQQVVKITDRGRRRILKYALAEIEIKKPKNWDKIWRLVSYDLPKTANFHRDLFRQYLLSWGFYQFQESVFLHAYPCEKEVEFLKEYLAIGEYVRILRVVAIENDQAYRDFFGV